MPGRARFFFAGGPGGGSCCCAPPEDETAAIVGDASTTSIYLQNLDFLPFPLQKRSVTFGGASTTTAARDQEAKQLGA
jgi:hypothetical protein